MLQRLSGFKEPTALDYNKLVAAFNRLMQSSGSAPIEVAKNAGALQIRMTSQGFTAIVTDVTDNGEGASPRYRYSVAEVTRDLAEPGLWVELEGGRVLADMVYEWNDAEVEIDTVVRVEPFGENDWRFDQDDGGESERDSGSCGGCGWLAEEIDTSLSALKLTVPTALGRCACIPEEQGEGEYEADIVYLVWDPTELGVVALKPFRTCCGCANLKWVQDAANLTATLSMTQNTNSCASGNPYSFNFTAECCQTGQITFVGYGADNCEGEKEACENIFRVQLECVPMPDGNVCDCMQCNSCCSSAAARWMKIPNPGFSAEGMDVFNINWYLEHVEGCVWQASCGETTVTLEHIAPNWVVTFTGGESSAGITSASYTLIDSTYFCCGDNVFSHTPAEGTPDTIAVNSFSMPTACVPPCCEFPSSLNISITPEGCGTFNLTLPAENDPPTSWHVGDFVWGECCPCWPIETTGVQVDCAGDNGFNISIGSPTTEVVDVVVTVLSVSPIHLTATGTLICGGDGTEEGCQPSEHSVTIEVTE